MFHWKYNYSISGSEKSSTTKSSIFLSSRKESHSQLILHKSASKLTFDNLPPAPYTLQTSYTDHQNNDQKTSNMELKRSNTDHSRSHTDHITSHTDHIRSNADHNRSVTERSTRSDTEDLRSKTDNTRSNTDRNRSNTESQLSTSDTLPSNVHEKSNPLPIVDE